MAVVKTFDNKEQHARATALSLYPPLPSTNWKIASMPPFSDIDRQISSCRKRTEDSDKGAKLQISKVHAKRLGKYKKKKDHSSFRH